MVHRPSRLLDLAVIVVALLEAAGAVRCRWNRSRRRIAGWWEQVEYRQDARLYEAFLRVALVRVPAASGPVPPVPGARNQDRPGPYPRTPASGSAPPVR